MKRILYLFTLIILLQNDVFGQNFSFNYDGLLRTYIVHLPPNYSPVSTYSLVLNLHGYTSSASAQEQYSNFNVVADTANVIVVYPDGVNNAWNSGWSSPYHSGVDDVGFLSALIDTMLSNYSINPCRVYSIGMSNGGFMSHRLACELENKIAAIAGITGMLADSVAFYCQTTRAVPIMQIQGNADPVVNFNGSAFAYRSYNDMITWWNNHNGCNTSPSIVNYPNLNLTDNSTAELSIYNQCDGNSKIYGLKILNGGHTWPGGSIDIPSNGNTNRDIHASSEIWKFLSQFDCNSGVVGVEEVINQKGIKVYPNPSSSCINFSKSVDKIRVINTLGVVLYEYHNPLFIQVSTWQKGMYILEITSKNQMEYQTILIN
ncbi:MAG: T9SS type A sorting domain-containing protein [Bacteroidetes bacterium]|nr:T9SS type A sorting domain-containing protein [Bacteroidota bacterium]